MESHWEDKWVEYAVGGGTLSLPKILGEPAAHGAIVALEVDDFAKVFGDLRAGGISVAVEPYESPVCWLAVVSDPDGNPLCIHQRKTPAAPSVAP